MKEFKRGDSWIEWRDELELQVSSVWTGLDKVLERMRDCDPQLVHGETRVTEDAVHELIQEFSLVTEYDNHADWTYKFMSAKLFNVIYKRLDTHHRRTVHKEFLGEKCGFEVYRLLSKDQDPATDDLASTLLDRITAVSLRQVKGPIEELAALREVDNRLKEMERRLGRADGEGAKLQLATSQMVTGMLYARLLGPSTRMYLMQRNPTKVRSDFNVMLELVEEYKKLQTHAAPKKMDISSAYAQEDRWTSEEWVAYFEGWPAQEEH